MTSHQRPEMPISHHEAIELVNAIHAATDKRAALILAIQAIGRAERRGRAEIIGEQHIAIEATDHRQISPQILSHTSAATLDHLTSATIRDLFHSVAEAANAAPRPLFQSGAILYQLQQHELPPRRLAHFTIDAIPWISLRAMIYPTDSTT
jgi:hypothetical protein